MRNQILSMLFAIPVMACGNTNEEASPSPTNNAIPVGLSVSEVPGILSSYKRHTLCDAVQRFTGGSGLYEVLSLTSVVEAAPEPHRDRTQVYTYVSLRLLEAWSKDAPALPVARMRGGLSSTGIMVPGTIEVSVGEKLPLLLQGPTEYNRGYFALNEQGTFRFDSEEGEYSNGLHRMGATLGKVRALVERTYGKSMAECRQSDVRAGSGRPIVPRPSVDDGYVGDVVLDDKPQ